MKYLIVFLFVLLPFFLPTQVFSGCNGSAVECCNLQTVTYCSATNRTKVCTIDENCGIGEGTCSDVASTEVCSNRNFCAERSDQNTCDFGQADSCRGRGGGTVYSGFCSWSAPPSPATCPSGQIWCAGCNKCMPNTQTCNQWQAANCGNPPGGGGGTGGSCSGACFSGIANCGAVGRTQVSGSCNAGELCCGFQPPDPPSSCNWPQSDRWPSKCYFGDRVQCDVTNCSIARPNQPACVSQCAQNLYRNYAATSFECVCQCGWTLTNPGTLTVNSSSLASNGTITVSWTTNPAYADGYQIQLYPATDDPNFPTGCTLSGGAANPYATCISRSGRTNGSYTFSPPEGAYSYFMRVRAYDENCSGKYSAWSSTTIYIAQVRGEVRRDTNDQAVLSSGRCVLSGAPLENQIGSASYTATDIFNDSYGTTVRTNGNFNAANVTYWPSPNGVTVTLNPGVNRVTGDTLYCTCPDNCTYTNVPTPVAANGNLPFFVSNIPPLQAWYQVINGNIYSGASSGIALRDVIPSTTCQTPGCKPALAVLDTSNTSNSDGIPLTAGGTVDTGGFNTQRAGTLAMVGTATSRFKENYAYFYRQTGLPFSPVDDFAATSTDARKPVVVKDVYFRQGDLRIEQPWTVNAGEKYIIMIDGNLTVADIANAGQLINVQPGGFLAFITSGNITFEASVGHSNLALTTANVAGIYIADGIISTSTGGAGTDRRFIGEGTFVGWTGVSLVREIDRVSGQTTPSEQFRYRPDFMVSLPNLLRRPHIIWQETN